MAGSSVMARTRSSNRPIARRWMVLWLDGDSSTGEEPNENYGRELLELFTVGIGNHDEDDVKAAARALTGYRVDRRSWTTVFVPRRIGRHRTMYLLLSARRLDATTALQWRLLDELRD